MDCSNIRFQSDWVLPDETVTREFRIPWGTIDDRILYRLETTVNAPAVQQRIETVSDVFRFE